MLGLQLDVPEDYAVMRRVFSVVIFLLVAGGVATSVTDLKRDTVNQWITSQIESAVTGNSADAVNPGVMPHLPKTGLANTARELAGSVPIPRVNLQRLVANHFWLTGAVAAIPMVMVGLVVFCLGIFSSWIRSMAKVLFGAGLFLGALSVGIDVVDNHRDIVFGALQRYLPIENLPAESYWALTLFAAAYLGFLTKRKLHDLGARKLAAKSMNRLSGAIHARGLNFRNLDQAFAHAKSMVRRRLATFEGIAPYASDYSLVVFPHGPWLRAIVKVGAVAGAIGSLNTWLN